MAGWGLQGTCQHILPHEPYVLCHNCQKRFGVVRMVCGCGLARGIRRQECVSFNCTDMPRIKEKNIHRGSQAQSSWHYHEKKCLFITRHQICESQNLTGSFQWCVRISLKVFFPLLCIQAAIAGRVTSCWLAAHTVLGKPEFWREAEIWDLLVPARNCQMFTGGCLTARVGAGLPQFLGSFSLHVSGTIHTSVWKPWPILGYASS